MRELSGLDIAGEVACTRPGTPVVIISGYVSEDLREAALHAGVKGVLEKQHTSEELGPLVLKRSLPTRHSLLPSTSEAFVRRSHGGLRLDSLTCDWLTGQGRPLQLGRTELSSRLS